MIPVTRFLQLMEHSVGKTPDPRHLFIEDFNRAGRDLVTEHDWNWRTKGPITVVGSPGVDWIELPPDFGNEISAVIDRTDATAKFDRVCLTTLEQIQRMREMVSATTATIYGAMLYMAFPHEHQSEDAQAKPVKRVHIYPQPSSGVIPRVTCFYRACWRECTGAAGELPGIPDEFEEVLRKRSCMYAKQVENPLLDYTVDQVNLRADLNRLVGEEMRRQQPIGRMTGGAGSRPRSGKPRHILGSVDFNE